MLQQAFIKRTFFFLVFSLRALAALDGSMLPRFRLVMAENWKSSSSSNKRRGMASSTIIDLDCTKRPSAGRQYGHDTCTCLRECRMVKNALRDDYMISSWFNSTRALFRLELGEHVLPRPTVGVL